MILRVEEDSRIGRSLRPHLGPQFEVTEIVIPNRTCIEQMAYRSVADQATILNTPRRPVFCSLPPVQRTAVDPVAVRRRLGLVFQAYNLFPHMTALENVMLGERRAHGASRAEAEAHGRELLARFGLAGREDDRPDNLSGGQQQRVAIARAFAGRPRVLLLDEITSALDPELVGEVLAAVRDLKAEGMTMLIATHEMSFAREVADQVAFLHEGRILEQGPPARVLGEPERPETRRFLRRFQGITQSI